MATVSSKQFFGGKPVKVVAPSFMPQQEGQKEPNFFQRTLVDANKRGQQIAGAVMKPAQDVASGASPLKILKSVGEAGLNTAGAVAGGIGDVIGEGLSSLTPKPVKDVLSSGVQKVAGTAPVQSAMQKWEEFSKKHPEAAKDLGSAFNIGALVGGGAGAKAVEPEVSGAIQAGKDALGGAVDGLAPDMSAVGRGLKEVGKSAYGVSVPMEEPTRLMVQSYQAGKPSLLERVRGSLSGNTVGRPITEAETAARHGLSGTEWELGVQAKRIGNDIWESTVKPKLESAKGSVNMKSFFDEIQKQIVKETPELSRRNARIEALQALRDEYKNVSHVSLSKLQAYKEGWAEFIPDATYKGKPIASALKDVKNLATRKARSAIYKYVGEDGKQAYLDYGNLQSIAKAGIKSADPLRSKSMGRQVWEAVLDKAVTPVATVAGKILYRTGEGLEFTGQKGAKTVKDIITQ